MPISTVLAAISVAAGRQHRPVEARLEVDPRRGLEEEVGPRGRQLGQRSTSAPPSARRSAPRAAPPSRAPLRRRARGGSSPASWGSRRCRGRWCSAPPRCRWASPGSRCPPRPVTAGEEERRLAVAGAEVGLGVLGDEDQPARHVGLLERRGQQRARRLVAGPEHHAQHLGARESPDSEPVVPVQLVLASDKSHVGILLIPSLLRPWRPARGRVAAARRASSARERLHPGRS